jgi:hypothetical protein
MDLRLSMRQVADGVIAHGPSVSGVAGGDKAEMPVSEQD